MYCLAMADIWGLIQGWNQRLSLKLPLHADGPWKTCGSWLDVTAEQNSAYATNS